VRKLLWTLGLVVGSYVVLALAIDAYVGFAQPELEGEPGEGVLVTFDETGARHGTRLAVFDDGTHLWVQSGHHFRGWYERLLRNPEVELVRAGETRRYRAVPLDDPESRAHLVGVIKARTGELGFRLIRALLLFAEIKPVRLDPRDAAKGAQREAGLD
jgi:hypothetical protein